MNEYQITREEFLKKNGFLNMPEVRLAYDRCKQDSLKDEEIVEKLKKRGFKNV